MEEDNDAHPKEQDSLVGRRDHRMTPVMDGLDSLFARIKQLLTDSTRSQRLVAAYFLEHHEQSVFMSIPQLAAAVKVSTATITRFAKELGYPTFSAFQNEFQELVRGRLKPTSRLMKRAKLSSHLSDQIRRCCEQDILNIQKTFEGIKLEEYRWAVRKIIESRWIWVVGFRGSYVLAYSMCFQLSKILRKSSLISSGAGEQLESTVMIRPRDLVIAFSFSRFTRQTKEVVCEAKKRGAITLTFTDRIVSPLTPYSDMNFITHVDGLSFHNSYVATMSLINCLLMEVASTAKDRCMKNLKDLDETLVRHGTFVFA